MEQGMYLHALILGHKHLAYACVDKSPNKLETLDRDWFGFLGVDEPSKLMKEILCKVEMQAQHVWIFLGQKTIVYI